MPLSSSFSRLSTFPIIVLSLLLCGMIAYVDYVTGPDLALSIFYLLPIGLIVWKVNLTAGIVISLVSGLLWLGADVAARHLSTIEPVHYWNATVRVGFFVTVCAVLSQRKILERRLIVAKEDAERLSRSLESSNRVLEEAMAIRSRFTSMVSHELRTPLTAIKEGIGIVLDGESGPVTADQRSMLELSRRNLDRLHALIDDVLDFTRLASGKEQFRIRPQALHPVLEEVVLTFSRAADSKGIRLVRDFDSSIKDVLMDQDKIIRVMNNLLSNALKFTKEGSVTIRTCAAGVSVNISVQDTGPGISSENLKKLFQEFVQFDSGTFRKPGGSGLGLAISEGIVRHHGGTMWADSVPGNGSTFTFSLPLSITSNNGPEIPDSSR